MIEYIRRADALKAMDSGNLHRGIVDALQSLILDVPTADVRPVVYCKDCKYSDKYCHCSYNDWYTNEYDYCSRGIRKEAETDEEPTGR